MINFKTIKQFSNESGYSEEAIRTKIAKGIWKENIYSKAPDGRVLISVEGYNQWARNGKVQEKLANQQSKLISASLNKGSMKSLWVNPLIIT